MEDKDRELPRKQNTKCGMKSKRKETRKLEAVPGGAPTDYKSQKERVKNQREGSDQRGRVRTLSKR